jgi:putative ABC transport system ATP-binding protein
LAPVLPPLDAPTEEVALAGELTEVHEEVLVEAVPTVEVPAAGGEPEPEPELDGTAAVSAYEAVKIYGEGANAVRAIDQVTHAFPRGRFTAIMGPSGSGKSTLLHCLGALDDLTSGKVFIGKIDVMALDEKGKTAVRRDKVGFIFQSYNLVPTLTALENITLPMELAQREPDQPWVNYLIQTVGLADRLDHLPSELSGGQQQRVAAVRALASKPEIVFADEPTGNLDSRRSAEILQFLRAAVDEFGQTIVMVTHDPIAACFADSVVFLVDGRVVSEMALPTVDRVLDQIKDLEAL